MKIYLAGGLFNAGERLHNLYLEKYLRKLGHDVVLPQREALNFFNEGFFDVKGIVKDCREKSCDPGCVYVGNIDGADADSGTAVEYGMAIVTNGRAVVYRTDFHTYIEKEIGLNAMLCAPGTKLVYEPCFFTELHQVEAYYIKLAQAIDDVIRSLT